MNALRQKQKQHQTVRRQKQVPLWLWRLDLVKAELKETRFPHTAEEGFRQCAMLSAIGLRFLRAAIKGEHPGASEEQNFGSGVRVIRPESLRNKVREEARKISQQE